MQIVTRSLVPADGHHIAGRLRYLQVTSFVAFVKVPVPHYTALVLPLYCILYSTTSVQAAKASGIRVQQVVWSRECRSARGVTHETTG